MRIPLAIVLLALCWPAAASANLPPPDYDGRVVSCSEKDARYCRIDGSVGRCVEFACYRPPCYRCVPISNADQAMAGGAAALLAGLVSGAVFYVRWRRRSRHAPAATR